MAGYHDFRTACQRVADFYDMSLEAVYRSDNGWLKYRVHLASKMYTRARFNKLVRTARFCSRWRESFKQRNDPDLEPPPDFGAMNLRE